MLPTVPQSAGHHITTQQPPPSPPPPPLPLFPTSALRISRMTARNASATFVSFCTMSCRKGRGVSKAQRGGCGAPSTFQCGKAVRVAAIVEPLPWPRSQRKQSPGFCRRNRPLFCPLCAMQPDPVGETAQSESEAVKVDGASLALSASSSHSWRPATQTPAFNVATDSRIGALSFFPSFFNTLAAWRSSGENDVRICCRPQRCICSWTPQSSVKPAPQAPWRPPRTLPS